MRASTCLRLFAFAALAGVVAVWFHERANAADLRDRSAALAQKQRQLSDLRTERDRLRGQLLNPVPGARSTSAVSTVQTSHQADAAAMPAAFAIGEWTPARAWKNEGLSTPRSTIATLLWAAGGGDLAAFQAVLDFSDEAQTKAGAWFETLPLATRSLYATPEDLVASATIKNIPPTAAQLIWFNQTDAEHVIVGVLLTAPESVEMVSAPVDEPRPVNAPPSLSKDSANRLAVLSLHRTATGWRVIVPGSAVDRMAKVLRLPVGQ